MTETPRAWVGVLHHIEVRLLADELGVGRSSVRMLDVLGLVRTQTSFGHQAEAIIIATPSEGCRHSCA